MFSCDEPTAALIRQALREDAADNDITALATVPPSRLSRGEIVAKAPGVLSGCAIAAACFHAVDSAIDCRWLVEDGARVAPGTRVAELHGPTRSLLAAERTALNFLQHLSGIASATARFVARVAGTGCAIYDTRKTLPGMRAAAKAAVVHGGGRNHRADLAGGFLIKENHILAAGSIGAAVARCRAAGSDRWIEVECETVAQVEEAAALAPELILLDNMAIGEVRRARAIVPRGGPTRLEASGGITLENVRAYAECGVERIAVGAITHSAPALDLSLLLRS
ncbi:MAG: carboxylating nicotinate-nucleotide diphosphorylase [Zetaproteobacteria bacterium]|nr:MAG: carboxylating nicotinate-nucleotide diphosphorylase [Zetaproteobacteria bacterium]